MEKSAVLSIIVIASLLLQTGAVPLLETDSNEVSYYVIGC